jgi:hypothetical protein
VRIRNRLRKCENYVLYVGSSDLEKICKPEEKMEESYSDIREGSYEVGR